ncbi:ATP-binding cassette domain-containing protein [Halobellus limi]|uniref:Sugar ABC transporter ATP-binding protein n=1 Tax=Halobellus limi TaxID=699433 RepID=A0A4D6H6W4_9EURY|nr:ATP-binding cassette domain-containing protein [Halobellus limi]QCC49405.1 sugar ABC transporter ATP-binding protein [Halobellus limi]
MYLANLHQRSGGERQAIAIARALVSDPDIVVMDEPTSALSTDSAERVQDLIKSLQDEGLSVIVISHNMDEIFSLTDRITVLDNGSLVGSVDTDDVNRNDIVHMMVNGELPEGIEEADAI